jgi:hypothetical protein
MKTAPKASRAFSSSMSVRSKDEGKGKGKDKDKDRDRDIKRSSSLQKRALKLF